ncbi:uncharacterized protein VTP21DRAFT_4479 [Calcarisporiella thermophila]|uniref:uncharacterized protein n=1 Tax=Calcarisporiella thermophila TaxID=911321 RepID=UPI0037429FE5
MEQARHLDSDSISELESVRLKLQQLQESLNYFLQTVNAKVPVQSWPELLNKYNILAAKFLSLQNDLLASQTLPKLVLHPHEPPQTDNESQILSFLLRTKLIPEIEKQEEETKIDVELGGSMDEDSARKALGELKKRQQQHDAFTSYASEFVENLLSEQKDMLFSTFYKEQLAEKEKEQPMEVEENGGELAEEAGQEKQPTWKTLGYENEEKYRRWQLESMLTFVSSGKEELEGSEVKAKPPPTKA